MSTHTPGPWVAKLEPGYWIIKSKSGHIEIADVFGLRRGEHDEDGEDKYIPDEEISANARLIAAAPDLLEACAAFVAWTKEQYPVWSLPDDLEIASLAQQAIDALAKARGETEPVAA